MCARYEHPKNTKILNKKYKVKIDPSVEEGWSQTRIVPRRFAPVVVEQKGERIVKPMIFSLLPKWAKEPVVKFATYNARLDSVDKPTWRRPFESQRCLIPVSEFYEPIYKGEYAGHWVKFLSNDILSAAGIWDEWVDKKSGEVTYSFSMLTDDPYPEVKKHGHPRSPLFLEESGFDGWLREEKKPFTELQEFALEHKLKAKLIAEQDEAMKPGWEKRIPKD